MESSATTWLLAHYPHEACGLIVDLGEGATFVPVDNIAPNPRTHFEMSDEALLRAELSGATIVAIVHSHPDGAARLSADDVERATYPTPDGLRALRPGVPYVVAAVSAHAVTDVRSYLFDDAVERFVEVTTTVEL